MAQTPADRMSFMEHLGELRTRIVRSLLALLVGTGVALAFSQKMVDYLARPIAEAGHNLVFLALTEAFWVQMKVAMIAGLFIASPAVLWQGWAFISPGLYAHEKKYAAPFVLVGSRSEEHTSELQSLAYLVCRLLLEKKKKKRT